MARSAGERPRAESCHASRTLPDSTACKTGTSAASSTVVSSPRSAEKAVVLRMMAGSVCRDQLFQSRSDLGVLQAAHRDAERRQPLAVERLHERGDRRDIRRHQVGAIEDDQRDRAPVRRLAQQP